METPGRNGWQLGVGILRANKHVGTHSQPVLSELRITTEATVVPPPLSAHRAPRPAKPDCDRTGGPAWGDPRRSPETLILQLVVGFYTHSQARRQTVQVIGVCTVPIKEQI
jgi:hypothetical protein